MPERVEVTVPAPLAGERVDRVVSFLTGVARAEAAAIVDAGGVVLRGRTVTSRSARVADGDMLEIVLPDRAPPPSAETGVSVDVVYEDPDVVVVDKPAGLVVHPGAGNPTGTLVQGLLARFPDIDGHEWPDPSRPGIVHRIDKGTSGLLVVARNPEALAALGTQLRDRSVERRYLALVWGELDQRSGVVDAPIGRAPSDPTRMTIRSDGRRAVTRYEVLEAWVEPQPTTLLRCALDTGRTHQIRVHLAAIGHPVVGDDRYLHRATGRQAPALDVGPAGAQRSRNRTRGVAVDASLTPGRPFLHAAVLGFDHPRSGGRLRFESPLPAELERVVGTLRQGRGNV